MRLFSTRKRFALTAVFTIAIAVGANLVVFTIVNALWLKPGVIEDPERVVLIRYGVETQRSSDAGTQQYRQMERLAARSLDGRPVFEFVAGQIATAGSSARHRVGMSVAGTGQELETMAVTWQYFRTFGLPVRGRDFSEDDDRQGAAPVAILSWRLWQQAYDGAPDVVGRTIETSLVPLRIVGIAPRGFDGARRGERTDLWIPSAISPALAPTGMSTDLYPLIVWARLGAGVTVADVERVMSEPAIGRDGRPRPVRVTYSFQHPGEVFGSPTSPTIALGDQRVLTIAGATAMLVLFSGIATLLALILVHYERRRQELAIRTALGSSRWQLVCHLARELGGLAAAGALAAIVVAWWSLGTLPSLALAGGVDFRRLDLTPDWRVGLAGLVGAVVSLGAAALLPLARSTRPGLSSELASGSPRATSSSVQLRQAALAGHVAATVLVLVGAGLFARTIASGFGEAPGFDLDRTVFIEGETSPEAENPGGYDEAAFFERHAVDVVRLVDELRAVNGVELVSQGSAPVGHDWAVAASATRWTLESGTERLEQLPLLLPVVGPGYFEALGVPVLAGRPLTSSDVVRSTGLAGFHRNVVITRSLAAALWPSGSPIGQSLTLTQASWPDVVSSTVVGVVADFVQGSLRTGHANGLFMAIDQAFAATGPRVELTIRTRGEARPSVSRIRQVVAGVFPNAPHVDIATGRDIVARDLGQERVGAWFFSGFGLVALCLGVAGVFGLVSYVAESRQREFGIRMALGATPGVLVRSVTGTGVLPVVTGISLGLVAAAALARTIEAFLTGVSRLDLPTYLAAGGVMLLCALVASALAARKIGSVSPVDALRAE